MGFPASVTTVTVTGRWRYADGRTAIPTGYVTFTPNVVLLDAPDGDILPVAPLKATLNAQGQISVTLMSTADPDLQPSGWAYVVNEFIGGTERTYLAGFPAVAPGQTYDLSSIAPATSNPVFGYVLLSSVGTVGGPAGPLDLTGNIPLSQLGNAPGGVPASRAINTTAPLTGGGTLAADRTLAVSNATAGAVGVVQLAGDLGGTATAPTVPGLAGKQPADAGLTSFAALTGAGFVVATATDVMAMRSLVGSSETGVTNPDGAAGNPTLTVTAVTPTASAVGDTSVAGGVATHRHAREGFGNVVAQTSFGASSSNGVATTDARSDHTHGTPSLAAQYANFVGPASVGANVANDATSPLGSRTEPGSIARLQGKLNLAATVVFAANTTVATLDSTAWPAKDTRVTIRTVGSSTLSVWTIAAADGTIKNVSAITAGGAGDQVNFDSVTYVHA